MLEKASCAEQHKKGPNKYFYCCCLLTETAILPNTGSGMQPYMSSDPPRDKNGKRHITSLQYFHFWSICCLISLIHQASLHTFNKASKKENKCPVQVT